MFDHSTPIQARLGPRHESLSAEIVRLRAALIVRDTALATARDELAALRAALPQLRTREALQKQCALLQGRLKALQQTLVKAHCPPHGGRPDRGHASAEAA